MLFSEWIWSESIPREIGGTLYQDIPTEIQTQIIHKQLQPKSCKTHDVIVFENSPMHKLMKTKVVSANSFHHQAIKELGKNLEVMGVAEDGIIEAVYLKVEQYLRAYQWHPEGLCDTDFNNRLIFDDFIKACKKWLNKFLWH